MKNLRLPAGALACIATAFQAAQAADASGTAAPDAWSRLATQEYSLALQQSAGDLPASQFARAVALLGVQPRTAGNLAEAQRLFTALAAAPLGDPWKLPARYFLGRIAEFHGAQPNYASAAAHYLTVFEAGPGEWLGQVALARHVLVRTQEPVTGAELRQRLAELEQFANRVAFSFAPARRDFHLALALAYCYAGFDQAAALRHSVAADEAGIVQWEQRSTNILRIAELARLLGDVPRARDYYRRFLATADRDPRGQFVRDQLALLGAGPVAALSPPAR